MCQGTCNTPSVDILQYFNYDHLPDRLQDTSKVFHTLAHWIVENLPANEERSVALRKILEAKDAAVRAKVFMKEPAPSLEALKNHIEEEVREGERIISDVA